MQSVKLKLLKGLSYSDIPDQSAAMNPGPMMSSTSTLTPEKSIGHDPFSDLETVDMQMFEELGSGMSFPDSLGNASMDSFTDLTSYLSQNSLLVQTEPDHEDPESTLLDLDADMKLNRHAWKRSYDEMDDCATDLGKLSASVGLIRSRTPSHDHDYTAKRPRMSSDVEEISAEETFIASSSITDSGVVPTPCLSPEPSVSPGPSTATSFSPGTSPGPAPPSSPSSSISDSADMTPEDKQRMRRQKNNLASKRSREIRKKKFSKMETEVDRLTTENARLEKLVGDMENMAKQMKAILLAKLKLT